MQKFELERFNQNVPDADLISDLQRVAGICEGRVTTSLYNQHGLYSSGTIRHRFGTWSRGLIEAGITPDTTKFEIPIAELLEYLRHVALNFNGKITGNQYNTLGKFNAKTFTNRFGTWNKALKAAGLEIQTQQSIEEDELLENLEQVWLKLGRQPRFSEMFYPLSRFSSGTYKNRYGSWTNALQHFVDVANSTDSLGHSTDSNIDKYESFSPISVTQDEITFSKHLTKRDPNLRLRWLVYKRDNFRCVSCGRSPAKDANVELHVDHVIPWSKGGETILENLQLLCTDCNLGKSNIE
jgi:hypothetical protein